MIGKLPNLNIGFVKSADFTEFFSSSFFSSKILLINEEDKIFFIYKNKQKKVRKLCLILSCTGIGNLFTQIIF